MNQKYLFRKSNSYNYFLSFNHFITQISIISIVLIYFILFDIVIYNNNRIFTKNIIGIR